MARTYFVTGTDTGVGKTVLTCLLVRHLRESGINALAVKPFCSGGRDDALLLREAQHHEPSLEEINPWHFRAPLAPVLAARLEKREVSRKEVVNYLIQCGLRCDVLLIEGAGGLLSPLGERFDARDLIADLKATPVVVGTNRLGVVNQIRLVIEALPQPVRDRARIALMTSTEVDQATDNNPALLAEFVPISGIALIPRVNWPTVVGLPQLPATLTEVIRNWWLRTDS